MSKNLQRGLLFLLIGSLLLNLILLQLTERYVKNLYGTRFDPLGETQSWWRDEVISAELPNVILLGDSRAANWTFPPTDRFNQYNRGIGAQSSSQIALRYNAHVAPLDPDIVIIQMGINDLVGIPLPMWSRTQVVERVQSNIAQTVTSAHADNATVIITTIFPVGGIPIHQYFVWSGDVLPALDEVNEYIRSLEAENVVVFDSYQLLVDENGRTQKPYRDDFMHINTAGYDKLNSELMPVVIDQLATR